MGKTVKGTVGGLPAFIKKQMEGLRSEVFKATYEVALLGTALAVAETDKKGSVDRGQLKNSWDAKRKGFGAEIRNDAPYSGFVERGTRPHWPPLLPIALWVNRKFGRPKNAVAIARAIQKKIATHGTKPRFIMRDILPKINGYFKRELRKAIERNA